MPTIIDYAALSAYIYNDQRGGGPQSTLNKLNLPQGWQDLASLGFTVDSNLNSNPFSFTAGAYLSAAGEIVIAYKGTDFLTEFEGRSWNTVADLIADVGLATAVSNLNVGQQLYASSFFLAVKDWAVDHGYDASKISFTGHSLGGGLASNMAVWFDRPAFTFAEGPFEIGTIDPIAVTAAAAALTLQAGVTASQAVLEEILKLPGAYANFAAREARVTNYAIGGEFLGYLRAQWPTVVGSGADNTIDIGNQPVSRMVDLHSMNIHLALLFDDRLRLACLNIPELVPTLLEKTLYKFDPNYGTEDFITRLVADQLQGNSTRQNGLLGKFVDDLNRISTSNGMSAQSSVRTGLIAAAMEYYYLKTSTQTTQLFTVNGNGIHFKYADVGVDPFALKSPLKLGAAMESFLSADEWAAFGYKFANQDAWHIQSGTSGMLWTASGPAAFDAAIGGAQTDVLDGGAGDDILVGGAGQDFLTGASGSDTLIGGLGTDWMEGGVGNDRLTGGADADIYRFAGTFGSDSIEDSGVSDVIQLASLGNLTGSGAKKTSPTTWAIDDKSVTYNLLQVDETHQDLVIRITSTDVGVITVRNWVDGQFGINLGTELAQPSVTNTFSGDITKLTSPDGSQFQIGPDGNYVSGGAQADSADVLNGSLSSDAIYGLGGNDGLAGGAGNDSIDGGAGNDLILGGSGSDTLNGGLGNDEILGSAGGLISRPTATDFTPPTASEVEISRGFSWVIFQPTGSNFYQIVGTTGITPNGETTGNVIDGGGGNDRIGAGSGADLVHGGDNDDTIVGMGGADVLYGDAGADVINGDGPDGTQGGATTAAEHGDDILSGDAGNDYLRGQGGADVLYGGADNDTLYGDDYDLTITPVSIQGNDYLDGGIGDDKLVGGAFDDELYGDDGADSLWGDAGAVDSSSASYLLPLYQGNDYLDGEGGNDYLQGEGGNDTLFGGSENDTMIGDDIESRLAGANHGTDYLDGEAGDDQLAGHGGADTLYGGLGADFLDGDGAETDIAGSFHGADYLDGEEGNDDMIGRGGADTLYGGEGDDKLQGDSAISSTAAQYHGDDYLDGEAGNDSLYGQGGADTLVGGDGADYLDGDGHVADVPVANQGNDYLFGDAGADTLVGGAGADQLEGGADNDLLEGDLSSSQDGHGSDTLDGGDGDDVLYGEGGDDVLIGGAGNDWIAGEDQATASAVSSLSGNDYLGGGDGNDTLIGGNGNDWLDGGIGTDVMVGGSGRDTYVLAFDGSVKEVVETDIDSVFLLGRGTNVPISQKWTGAVVGDGDQYLTFESGTSRIQIKDGFGDGTQIYEFSDGTQWTQAQMLDHITTPLLLRGTPGSDAMRGGGGDDNLTGGEGDDVVIGGAGMDVLSGGTGNDAVDAGAGGGTARGDEGNDTYRFKRGDGQLTIDNTATDWATANDALKFGAGIAATDMAVNRVGNDLRVSILNTSDTVVVSNYYLRTDAYYRLGQVQFDDGTTWSRTTLEGRVSPEGTAGNDYLTGTANADLIHGGAGSDNLYGLAGDDQLFGEADQDTLAGGLGNDLLDGGAGTDSLYGDVGNDTLVGGETMYGGDGNDTYVIDTLPMSTLVVSDTSGIDELILPAGATPGNVSVDLTYTYWPNHDALWMRVGTGGYIRVDGYFSSETVDSIEQIRFADGTTWSRFDVMSRVPSARLSDANDQSVNGYVWNDSLDGLGGNDNIRGRQGDDSLLGGSGQDSLYGDQGNDSVSGGTGDDSLFGDSDTFTSTGDGNDQISGGDGNDTMYGAAGLDTLDGGAGSDLMYGGDGNDIYVLSRSSGDDSIFDSNGVDRISYGSDVLPTSVTIFRDGADLVIAVDQNALQTRVLSHFAGSATTLDSITFADGTVWDAQAIATRTVSGTANAMTGTVGNDTFVVDNAADTITETLGGTDTVQSSVSWTLGTNLENLTLTGYVNLRGTGNSLNNVLSGNSGNNVLDGLTGLDTLIGGAGDDTYNVVAGEDTVVEAVGGGADTVVVATSYTLPDNVENLKLTPSAYTIVNAIGNALDNTISISGSLTYGNVIDGGAGADKMIFNGYGGVIFKVDNVADTVIATGADHTVISTVNWTLPSGVANLQLKGPATDGVGNEANNILIGTGQNGVLQGLGGNDTLYSDSQPSYQFAGTGYWTSWNSLGVDTLMGGTGNDSYYIFSTAGGTDVVVEAQGEGNDTVYIATNVSRTYDMSEFANVENLRLQKGSSDASLVGDASNNQLYGSVGNNSLVGGAGDDLLLDRGDSGALGTYEYDNDTLDGGDGNDQLTSTYGNDILDGGAGNDALNIGSSTTTATILFGRGDGSDTATLAAGGTRQFVLDSGITVSDLQVSRNQRDMVFGFGQGDSITVKNYFADATSVVPSGLFTNLQFADGLVLNEQALINRLVAGNSNLPTEAADLLVGSSGPDALDGLGGDDWIIGAGGADSLLGGAGADILTAGDGDDTLAGGAAADLLQGGAGSDTYRFANGDGFDTVEDSAGVDVVEFASGIAPSAVTVTRSGDDLQMLLVGGTDRVTLKGFFASASSEIESVRFADGTIWTLSMLKEMGTQIVGTAGPDSLSGSAADERLSGLAGNDTLNGAAGNDSLDGGDGDDSLIGGAGLDTLSGGAGNDTINPGAEFEFDVIRFGRGYGSDRITGYDATSDEIQFDAGVASSDLKFSFSGVNLVIGINGTTDALTVEQFANYWNQVTLRFTEGTTWTAAQVWQALTTVTGTEAADIINGTANGDRIYANGGNDTVDGLGGNDLIEGGAGDDSLTGGAGYDTLNGGLGIDRMTGGTEDDYYVVDNTSDVVVELSGGGSDSVESSVTYTLATNVENLWLTGGVNITGTGNTLNNVLSGNAGNTTLVGGSGDDDLSDYDGGNDSLNGGTGGDYMEAGTGDDTYVVDSALDQVYEYAAEGNDLVQSSINYVLPDEVERLTLTGTSGLTGTGNILDNVLTGNSGANRLDGGDGNDTIDGGTGIDTMIGGAGNDVYFVNVATDVVTEGLNAGVDTINSAVTLTSLAANVESVTLTGTGALKVTGNGLANVLIGNSGNNSLTGGDGDDTIDGGLGNDSMVGGLGNDNFYINVSTDVVTEAASAGTDTVMAGITYTLMTNFENLTLTGTSALNGTGNTVANALTGNGAANTLTGNAGNDTLDGAAGNDSLVGGTGADVYRFAAGYGVDTVTENDATTNITDAVQFVGTVTQANVQFMQVGNNLEVLLTGTSDKIVVQNWYLGTQYQVEEFRFTDGTILTNSQAQGKVTAGAVASAMSVSTLADPAAGIASATGSKQIHMWRQPVAESSAFGAPAAVAMLDGVLALVNRSASSEVPALAESVEAVEPGTNLQHWVQTLRQAWAPIASGTVAAMPGLSLPLDVMSKAKSASAAGASDTARLNPVVKSTMPTVRLLGMPVLGASATAVTGLAHAVVAPLANIAPVSAVGLMPDFRLDPSPDSGQVAPGLAPGVTRSVPVRSATPPAFAPVQALAPERGVPALSSDATPASEGYGRKSIPTSQGGHLDALDPPGSGPDWLGALMQRRLQDLPDVMGLQLHDGAADQFQWVRQASALVEAMAQFNAAAATADGISLAGSHVMLDKVTMPGLSV